MKNVKKPKNHCYSDLKSDLDLNINHEYYMQIAVDLAKKSLNNNTIQEVPIGCLIVIKNNSVQATNKAHINTQIIASAYQKKENLHDPTAHAELLAIRQACESKKNWRLNNCILYSTIEPCLMCAAAIIHARIPIVVFGASNKKFGGFGGLIDLCSLNNINHKPKIISQIKKDLCIALLKDFFKAKREKN